MKQEVRRKKQESAARSNKRFLLSPFSFLPASSEGFTLIELLVTISIFIIMTALIISRYGAFNQGTLMTNLAYDVALSIRTAQTYGVSVKGIEDNSTNAGTGFNQTFSGSYGIDFDISDSSLVHSFVMYLDSDGNDFYNSGVDTLLGSYTIKQGARISLLCASIDGGKTCVNGISTIDIAFKRPDPSAIISGNQRQIPGQPGTPSYNFARITLTSADGSATRTITVRGNGQISVGN